jgi:hypothetical protein
MSSYFSYLLIFLWATPLHPFLKTRLEWGFTEFSSKFFRNGGYNEPLALF